jgi:Transposase
MEILFTRKTFMSLRTSSCPKDVKHDFVSDAWIPIHAVLEDTIDLIVANAYKIKHTPRRKNDISDSEWLAELCLNGVIEPSRIFHNADNLEIRRLTRAREGYVNDMTRERTGSVDGG